MHCFTTHRPAVSRHCVQNNAARIVLQAPRRCHAHPVPAPLAAGSSQNHLQYGSEDLQDPQHIDPRESIRTLRSSKTSLLTVPFIRTELAKCAFRRAAPSFWNALPSFIYNSSPLTSFKYRLKTYFFRLSFDCSVHV